MTIFRDNSRAVQSANRGMRKRCFTLAEAVIALSIAILVLTSLTSMFLFMVKSWHSGTANWHLDQNVRIARERILRGIEGRYGIREAEMGSVQIFPGHSEHVNWIDFDCDDNEIPTPDRWNDNVTVRLLVNPGHNELHARTTPGSGTPRQLLPTEIQTDMLEFELNDRVLTVDFTMSLNGTPNYQRRMVVSSYLVND